MDKAEQFGANLAQQRERRGLSRRELAHALDVGESYVWRLETGRSTPSFGMLIRIAEALSIPPADLFAGIK